MTTDQGLRPNLAYVVASNSRQNVIRGLIESLGAHPFLRHVQIRILSFEEFESTPCFPRIIESTRQSQYRRSKTGELQILWEIIPLERDDLECALIVPANTDLDPHGLLHEFGHISLARTPRFRELRKLWMTQESRLRSVIGFAINLAERLIFSPEDTEIERTITSSYSERRAQEYFERVYQEYCSGLTRLEEARAWAPRLEVALNGFQYSLATRFYREIALERGSSELSDRFSRLSERYAEAALLPDIDLDRFLYLMEQESLKEWIVECSNAIVTLA
jgi:hypothetical protein